MLDATEFRKLVSGERRGISASLLRAALSAAEIPYRLGVGWRNWRFDSGRREIHRVEVPVISVGNLTVGGTGKTPMVEWLARWFRERDVRVCLVSRGYGAEAGARNDEALELEQRLLDVPHLQNPDRVEAARTAIEECETQLIVLDDAFQHRRLHRDLDIVLIDASEPFGFGHLLPRGLLREPLKGLSRADVVVLTRSDMVPEETRRAIRARVERHARDCVWVEVTHKPIAFRSASGAQRSLDALAGQRILAFCGIGNPGNFRHTLDREGWEVVGFRPFPDHHRYQRSDVDELTAWVASHPGIAAIVCTHKDLVKLQLDRIGNHPLLALTIGTRFQIGQDDLEARLAGLIPQ